MTNMRPPTLPDHDIDRLIEHYQSPEYIRESGGGWKPLSALLELRDRRNANALTDPERADLIELRDCAAADAERAQLSDRFDDAQRYLDRAAMFDRLIAGVQPPCVSVADKPALNGMFIDMSMARIDAEERGATELIKVLDARIEIVNRIRKSIR